MITTRLSSWLVAGSIALTGGWLDSLHGGTSVPAPTSGRPMVAAANLESTDNYARVRIHIPGFSGKPGVQVIPSSGRFPDRLVVDFRGVDLGRAVSKRDVPGLTHPFILAARLAQFAVEPQSVTRMVLELTPGVNAVVYPDSQGVSISLTKGAGKVRARLSETPILPEENPLIGSVANRYSQEPATTEYFANLQTTASSAPITENSATNSVASDLESEAALASSAGSIEKLPRIGSPYIGLPSLGSVPLAPVALQGFASSVDPLFRTNQTPVQQPTRNALIPQHEFTGERINISVHNAELRGILSTIAEVAGLNLIIDPDAQLSQVSYNFHNTPWDQILDAVVKTSGLGMEINNGILRIAKVEKFKKEEEDRRQLEEARAMSGEMVTEVRALSYAKVDDVTKIIENFKSSNRAKVFTDTRTNKIIMTDLPRYVENMQRLLDQLDVRVPQVQIDVRLVEANRGWEKAFGVSWPQANTGNANLQANGQNASWGANDGPSWNSMNSRSAGGNVLNTAFAPGMQGVTSIPRPAAEVWVSFLTNRISLNAIIQALEKNNQIKMISEPKLTAFNNSPGEIGDGQRIPYQAMQSGLTAGVMSVEFVNAELKLTVTPQITNAGTIILDVEIKKEQADFSQQINGTPTILSKSVKTKVLVDDGGTAVLGGVYTNLNDSGIVGVPFLSKLPGLGWLFRSRTSNDRTTEMLVFISPKILH